MVYRTSPSAAPSKKHNTRGPKSQKRKDTKERRNLQKKIEEYVGSKCYNMHDAMCKLEKHVSNSNTQTVSAQDGDGRSII